MPVNCTPSDPTNATVLSEIIGSFYSSTPTISGSLLCSHPNVRGELILFVTRSDSSTRSSVGDTSSEEEILLTPRSNNQLNTPSPSVTGTSTRPLPTHRPSSDADRVHRVIRSAAFKRKYFSVEKFN